MRRRNRWTAVLGVALAILAVSVVPIPGAVPDEGGGIPTSVMFHFLGYATLAALIGVALLVRQPPVRGSGTGLASASAYGVLIECLQYPIPYRSFSYVDMLVNGAGATLGALVALGVLAARSDDHR
ncbi:MAG: VanZ family protein [Halalkalicoccus sp.]|nr:VanZ family protein [Halalkalicoccus sp.]